ncbi:protein NRT1/ PTR FAMILY 3.1-like [Actinidia eriantha]|uniref:protein NRT1/ PTR FAMILY 3.1-like n=1 Tax=Actinidia eriantha TaxID=165200 RepID=UPI00258DC1CC|nr:protein NRT1/ PTR FAMILY 3.1-like [Actinidia eriantha]
MKSQRNMNANVEEDTREIEKKKKKELGGIKTLPFILANEMSERFATVGFQGNMITYLTQVLNLPLVKASNTLTNFNGTAGFTPLIGALLADAFAGRFSTIIVGSIIYELGLVSIILSAVLPGFRPPPCPTKVDCKEATTLQLWVLYSSLLLTSLGLGGVRPCVVTFAADQLSMTKKETESRTWNFFNWYYFCLEMASLLALTFVVYVQDNVGWGWGLGIPTIAMALSVIVFVIGSPYYKKYKPQGSPLIRLAQVIVAAVRKRKAIAPADSGLLYENKELDDAISLNGRLLHTNHFKCLDKAAVITDHVESDSNPPNLWRLSTVHRVEELKAIIRMLPIWAAGILPITAYSHQESFSIQQARTMDRSLYHTFQIPPATMSIFEILSVLFGILLYERLFIPFARRITKNPTGITFLQRIGIGFTINILGTFISALVETKRKAVAANHGLLDKPTAIIPITVFWLVPQYSIHGMALVFITVGRLEFFYDQSPESMRSTAASFFWIAIAVGNYTGTLMVSLIHKYSEKGIRNWIPERNLNRGRLENYYFFVSGLQVINLIYYVMCTRFYTYKVLEEVSEGGTEGDVELATNKIPPRPMGDDNGI